MSFFSVWLLLLHNAKAEAKKTITLIYLEGSHTAKSEKQFFLFCKSMGKGTRTTTESTAQKMCRIVSIRVATNQSVRSMNADALRLCLRLLCWCWCCCCHFQMDVPSPHAICITWKLIQIKLLTLAFTTWYDLLSQSLVVVAVAAANTVCLFVYLRFFPSQFPPKQITKQSKTEQNKISVLYVKYIRLKTYKHTQGEKEFGSMSEGPRFFFIEWSTIDGVCFLSVLLRLLLLLL